MLARTLIFVALAGSLVEPGAAAASGYVEMRAAAVTRCEAIDPSAHQTGMIFNPEGYRSMYFRSACFQDAAVLFRDEPLCAKVKERRSFFFSSWGYSPKHCRQRVAEGLAADRKGLEQLRSRYQQGAVTLRDFRIERNGNGRDFDSIPTFDTGFAHSYSLRFEILDAEATEGRALLDSSGFHLDAE